MSLVEKRQSMISRHPLLKIVMARTDQEYVDDKKSRGESPLKEEEWKARTQGKDEGGADKPKQESKSRSREVALKMLSQVKDVSSNVTSAIKKAPAEVHTFVADKTSRSEALKQVSSSIREAPKKIADSIWAGAKKEVHELKHAGKAIAKILGKPRKDWDSEDKKAVYSASLYVAGTVLAATGGGAVVAAGAFGKSFVAHVAAKALHHVIDKGFTHFEAGEVLTHAVHLLHLAAEDDAHQRLLTDYLTVAVGAVLDKGLSDSEMEAILQEKKIDTDDFGQPKEVKPTKEGSLRARLIRLAHENVQLRPHLLGILKKGKGVYVPVKNLPSVVQQALKEVRYGKPIIEVEAQSTVNILGLGGTGSRDFAVMINLETDQYKVEMGSWGGPSGFGRPKRVDYDDQHHVIPENGAVILGSQGGGPTYAQLYVHPINMPQLLPSTVDLTPKEKQALSLINGIKGSYRESEFAYANLGSYSPQNPIILSLVAKGLVQITKVGIKITLAGKNAL
jgi:hypothetical protein